MQEAFAECVGVQMRITGNQCTFTVNRPDETEEQRLLRESEEERLRREADSEKTRAWPA